MSEPTEVRFLEVAREFARRSLAHGVPPQELAAAMTGAAVDVVVTFAGEDAMRDWIREVAEPLARCEETLQ